MEHYSRDSFINMGFGVKVSILEIARIVGDVMGFSGSVKWDVSKSDGRPRKIMDSSRLADMGWKPRIGLVEGVAFAYRDFQLRLGSQSTP